MTHHMTPDEFRKRGGEVIEFIASYMERIQAGDDDAMPVLSRVKPGEVRAMLPPSPPVAGESFDAMLRDVERIILPGVTHWQSPNFFAYFPCNNSGPSILGELLSAGLGVQGMLWATSPACTELETHVLDWIVELLDLPRKFLSTSIAGGGVIQDTASSAALCALLAARERATGGASNASGVRQRLTAYASSQAHSSIEKAIVIAGLGRENLRLIDVDEQFRMKPESLRQAMERDVNAGFTPCFVCATVGTTSSNAIDPVRAIADVCSAFPVAWLHVDAAMSGTAAVCPEYRFIHDGLDLADSYCFNPHKWMFTNFDGNCFYVADRAALVGALSILPEYLKNAATESGAVIDYRDWQIPLGRRFRALKLWFVIRHYGIEGLRAHLREHIAIAQQFAAWVRADQALVLAVEPPLNLVCFRHIAGEATTRRIMERVNASGRMYLTHTLLGGQFTLRMSIGGTHTRLEHVQQAWSLIRAAASG